MYNFFVSVIILSIVSYGFAEHNLIHRKGVQIRGSFGEGLKKPYKETSGSGYLSNRFGDASASEIVNRHIQIRGSFGGHHKRASSGNVNFGNRFGETSGTSGTYLPPKGAPLIIFGGYTGTGIGTKPVGGGINEILEKNGLGGDPDTGCQLQGGLVGAGQNAGSGNLGGGLSISSTDKGYIGVSSGSANENQSYVNTGSRSIRSGLVDDGLDATQAGVDVVVVVFEEYKN